MPTPLKTISLAALLIASDALAYAGGIVGYSGQTAGTSCVSCHAVSTGAAPTVAITGPATLQPGATGNYTLTITGGPGVRGGMNVSKDVAGGQLQGDGTTTQASAGEITHNGARSFVGGQVAFNFRLVAPATAGTVRLFGAGNSANNAGGAGGDREALTIFTVNVTAANAAPTVATPAAAAQPTVTGTAVNLTVLGADDQGEPALTYTWTSTGPAAVTFSANGANGAKATTATFTRAGSYTFTATVRDAAGLTATSAVNVTVAQALSQLAVTPSSAGIAPSGSQQFAAAGVDQFGQPQAVAPAWSVSGGGAISTAGLFTAGAAPGGPHTVTATQGGRSATAQITISAGTPPVVATPAAAAQNPVTGTSVALSVAGSDDGGAAAILYTWAAMAPVAPVTFSANGTNAARNTTATFTRAGQYTFVVTLRDGVGLTSSSTVVVDVAPTVAAVVVSPSSIALAQGGTTVFTAAASDQFAAPISPAPSFAWSASGGGTISSGGLFRAGTAPGGPHTVTAAAGARQGTASVTISTSSVPTVAQAPVATPELVTGRTTSLRVLGADGQGEAGLVYRWSATGPAPVSFSANDSNAAKLATATFAAVGDYALTVQVVNGQGQAAQATLPVSVRPALSGLTLSPATAAVPPLGSQAFAAQQVDQFGAPLAQPLDVLWMVSGGGAIDQAGTFTARDASGGPFVVSASALGFRSTAQVTIGPGGIAWVPPTVAIVDPFAGKRVRGALQVRLDAAAPSGVREVEVLVDGARVALLTAAPFELQLDTEQFSDGEHALDARVVDAAGNVARAETVRLFFLNHDLGAETVVGQVDFGCSSAGGQLFVFTLGALVPLLRRRKGDRRT